MVHIDRSQNQAPGDRVAGPVEGVGDVTLRVALAQDVTFMGDTEGKPLRGGGQFHTNGDYLGAVGDGNSEGFGMAPHILGDRSVLLAAGGARTDSNTSRRR
jgi:hypothetical protein